MLLYTGRTAPPMPLTGSSTCGQMLDWHQRVKPAMRDAVLRGLKRMDPQAPWTAFPLQTLSASCAIAAFQAEPG